MNSGLLPQILVAAIPAVVVFVIARRRLCTPPQLSRLAICLYVSALVQPGINLGGSTLYGWQALVSSFQGVLLHPGAVISTITNVLFWGNAAGLPFIRSQASVWAVCLAWLGFAGSIGSIAANDLGDLNNVYLGCGMWIASHAALACALTQTRSSQQIAEAMSKPNEQHPRMQNGLFIGLLIAIIIGAVTQVLLYELPRRRFVAELRNRREDPVIRERIAADCDQVFERACRSHRFPKINEQLGEFQRFEDAEIGTERDWPKYESAHPEEPWPDLILLRQAVFTQRTIKVVVEVWSGPVTRVESAVLLTGEVTVLHAKMSHPECYQQSW